LILVAIPILSGARNPIRTVIITLAHFVDATLYNFKMAANEKMFFSHISVGEKHRDLILVFIPMFSGIRNPTINVFHALP